MSSSLPKQDDETILLSECEFMIKKINVLQDQSWTVTNDEMDDDNDGSTSLTCTVLDDKNDKAIRILSNRHRGGGMGGSVNIHNVTVQSSPYFKWKKDDFHKDLRCFPYNQNDANMDNDTVNEGMVAMFEAMASEGIVVALSSKPYFQIGNTYEIYLGIVGNTKLSVVCRRKRKRRQQQQQQNEYQISIPTRVCCEQKGKNYISFWIVYYQNIVYVGLGKIPGQQYLVHLSIPPEDDDNDNAEKFVKDEEEDKIKKEDEDENNDNNDTKETSEADDDGENKKTVKKEEDGDEDDKQKEEEEQQQEQNEKDKEEDLIPKYIGFGNWTHPNQHRIIKIKNLLITNEVPIFLQVQLMGIVEKQLEEEERNKNNLNKIGKHDDDENNEKTELFYFQKYQDECKKQRLRASKFGIPYKEPSMEKTIPWTILKKLKLNPEQRTGSTEDNSIITGFDTMSKEEKLKQQKRKERFLLNTNIDDSKKNDNDNENENEDKNDNNNNVNGNDGNSTANINILEAWDNESYVSRFRTDLPSYLWPENEEGKEDKEQQQQEENNASIVPEKIHIFSIDWAAFKQIRTNDLMSYFSIYGPTYVEWLGELSCNIVFEDKYSARRALYNLTHEIPSPPPSVAQRQSKLNDGSVINEDSADNDNDKQNNNNKDGDGDNNGDDNDEAKKEDGDDSKNNMINNEDIDVDGNGKANENNASNNSQHSTNSALSAPLTDIGRMGWRMGTQPIRKIKDDRFGRRGTTSRILIRMASSLDILIERPNSWPKPPPGFTTKHILGPGSDNYDNKNNNSNSNRKRRRGGGNRAEEDFAGPGKRREQEQHHQNKKWGRGGEAAEHHSRKKNKRARNKEGGSSSFKQQKNKRRKSNDDSNKDGSTDGNAEPSLLNQGLRSSR